MNNATDALSWVIRETDSIVVSPFPLGPGKPMHTVGIRQVRANDPEVAAILLAVQGTPKSEGRVTLTDDQLARIVAMADDLTQYQILSSKVAR